MLESGTPLELEDDRERLPGGRPVRLESSDHPERRGVLLAGKRTAALADQQNHRVALLNVGPKLFEQRRRALAEVFLVPHLQLLAPQHPGELDPVGAQLPRDRREEDAIGDGAVIAWLSV